MIIYHHIEFYGSGTKNQYKFSHFLRDFEARSGSASFGPGYGASGDLEAATSAAKALLSDRATAMKERLDTWPPPSDCASPVALVKSWGKANEPSPM